MPVSYTHLDVYKRQAILFTIGALFVGFSKQKNEDEYIASVRHDSLLWATYVNYMLLILSMLFIYDAGFFTVMVYNMFTVLIIFLLSQKTKLNFLFNLKKEFN